MSGGSYNYLENQPLTPECWSDLRNMLTRLEGMRDRHPAAYDRMRRIVGMIQTAELEAEGLAPVFHAVEWRDSADWNTDDMHQAIDAWAKEVGELPDVDLGEGEWNTGKSLKAAVNMATEAIDRAHRDGLVIPPQAASGVALLDTVAQVLDAQSSARRDHTVTKNPVT